MFLPCVERGNSMSIAELMTGIRRRDSVLPDRNRESRYFAGLLRGKNATLSASPVAVERTLGTEHASVS